MTSQGLKAWGDRQYARFAAMVREATGMRESTQASLGHVCVITDCYIFHTGRRFDLVQVVASAAGLAASIVVVYEFGSVQTLFTVAHTPDGKWRIVRSRTDFPLPGSGLEHVFVADALEAEVDETTALVAIRSMFPPKAALAPEVPAATV